VGASLAHGWEPLSGAVPPSEVNDGGCPEKTDHLSLNVEDATEKHRLSYQPTHIHEHQSYPSEDSFHISHHNDAVKQVCLLFLK
jgi:hypothetical protein